jgi:hypothetical protein
VTASTSQSPEELDKQVRDALESLCERFGEQAIGGPPYPKQGVASQLTMHRTTDLEVARGNELRKFNDQLKQWSPAPGPHRVRVLVSVFWEAWKLWDVSLAYNTLDVVEEATAAFVESAEGDGRSAQDWVPALRALRQAMKLIIADTRIFREINLSSAEGLKTEANTAVETLSTIESALNAASLGSPPWEDDKDTSLIEGLAEISGEAHQCRMFYVALASAAEALIEFESWLAAAPRVGSPTKDSSDSPPARPEPLTSINKAIKQFQDAQHSFEALTLERSEPWERLLVEVRDIVDPGSNGNSTKIDTGTANQVFVPKRVTIRYCYPFAVEASEDDPPQLKDLLKEDLNTALEKLKLVKVRELNPLAPTQFFARDVGLYGGVRVDLPDIKFHYGKLNGADSDGKGARCKVWLDLSDMGNHCLCIQPGPLEAPVPHLLYRAVRAGTPFVLGEEVVLTAPVPEKTDAPVPDKSDDPAEVAWDDLQLFSRDVIEAIALADFWNLDEDFPIEERYVRGNLHEVIVVRTDEPLSPQSEDVAETLENAVGGRLLLRSIQRTATTLEEWVRYPRLPRPETQGRTPAIEGIPEMGLEGDWSRQTGETTVFGIVAAPSWHSDVYVEAAQFVSSWSPLLRLWGRRFQRSIEASKPGADQQNGARMLRQVERNVRLRLTQIRAEDLCATLAHRRFLDQLMEMANFDRPQAELEAQLQAAERLTDWSDEEQHRRADGRRQVLLGVIALFAVFELGGFLSLANETGFKFMTITRGVAEDWLVLAVFLISLFAAVIYFNILGGIWDWLRRRFVSFRRWFTPDGRSQIRKERMQKRKRRSQKRKRRSQKRKAQASQ